MLLSTVCKENLVCIAVDEAHCVKLWGAQFRSAFNQIGDLQSIIPLFFFKLLGARKEVSLALCAILQLFSEQLPLLQAVLVALPPNRSNIVLEVHLRVSTNSFVSCNMQRNED